MNKILQTIKLRIELFKILINVLYAQTASPPDPPDPGIRSYVFNGNIIYFVVQGNSLIRNIAVKFIVFA